MDIVRTLLTAAGEAALGVCLALNPLLLPETGLVEPTLGGLPFCASAAAEAIERVEPIHRGKPRDREMLLRYLREVRFQSAKTGIPAEIVLAIGMQETRWRPWLRSPSEEFCGMFQQAPRYVLDPPLPPIGNRSRCLSLGYEPEECRQYTRPCRRVDRCAEKCDYLTDADQYRSHVAYVFDYLEIIRRRTGSPWEVCRYQGGPFRPCDEAALGYQERHERWRERILTAYRNVLREETLWCD